MPKLIIDEQEIVVPEGTKVIEAAERLGIMIPRFCYHPALGSVGACRVCAVKFMEGPHKGVDMSCMVDAKDGMVVSTTDEEAVQFRKYVIEWLMLNHPLDCPVCDEGGHCLLQDETVSGGHGIRRYLGKKRTYFDQDLGPFVQHEMNRCIHCFRCRRFYQDFAGYRDLGVMQIGNREYFGRAESGRLESPFSGNIIDICPTGVYTDKPARFKGRRWNFERGPTLCIHCSLGCNTTGSARYREMLRQESRLNEAVNGYFICDRGRYGFDFANHPDRPRRARVGDQEVSWKEGIQAAAERLRGIGKEEVLCVGSHRCSLEAQACIKRMSRLLGWAEPYFFMEPDTMKKVKTAVARLDERLAVSMRQIEEADFILALGADPVNEAPMLALAMRQAWRKGAGVAVVDPRPVFLPFSFLHVAVVPDHIDLCAAFIAKRALNGNSGGKLSKNATRFRDSLPEAYKPNPDLQNSMEDIARKLRSSKKPVIVCGTDIVRESTPALAADVANLVCQTTEGAGLFYLLPGPNAFGAGLLSSWENQGSVLESIGSGKLKALVLVEQDPLWGCRDRLRMEQALNKMKQLIVLDYLPSSSVKRAHVVLPTTTLFERTAATFVNQEGRAQMTRPLHRGGTPLSQISGANHPPRTFLNDIPGGEPKTAHDVLAELYTAVSGEADGALLKHLWEWLAEEDPVFKASALSPQGNRFLPSEISKDDFFTAKIGKPETRKEGLEVVLTEWTFGTEELSTYSRFAREGETALKIFLHPEDAARLGLAEGDKTAFYLEGGEVVVELGLASNMARGTIIVPRHRRIEWQKLKRWPTIVPDDRIRKI
jgi:NADH-quinone oxidoreductase subunit G